MDEFGCDYECRTVGEGIIKYNIPDDWIVEFDVYNDVCPIICMQVDKIRKTPEIMDLKLRVVVKETEEYAGCMIVPDRKTIAFKINHISDLTKAIEKK